MKRLLTGSLMALAVLGASYVTSTVSAAPEPALVPPPGTYELTLKQFAPERFETTVDGKKVTYWYMRYTVTNNSGQDVVFTPEFELITDTGQSVKAFEKVPREVFSAIKKLHKAELMESQFEILGKLPQGAFNARDGVAIFSGVDPEARAFTIFVQGLANEVAKVKNPSGGKEVTLVKTLQLDYKLPGQQVGIDPLPEFKGKKWVMK